MCKSLFYRITQLLIWQANYAGGLLIDHGVPTLKPNTLPVDSVSGLPSDWIATAIHEKLSLTKEQLVLAQVLEGITWKGGREIAKQKRPETGSPPIEIESDGTVF